MPNHEALLAEFKTRLHCTLIAFGSDGAKLPQLFSAFRNEWHQEIHFYSSNLGYGGRRESVLNMLEELAKDGEINIISEQNIQMITVKVVPKPESAGNLALIDKSNAEAKKELDQKRLRMAKNFTPLAQINFNVPGSSFQMTSNDIGKGNNRFYCRNDFGDKPIYHMPEEESRNRPIIKFVQRSPETKQSEQNGTTQTESTIEMKTELIKEESCNISNEKNVSEAEKIPDPSADFEQREYQPIEIEREMTNSVTSTDKESSSVWSIPSQIDNASNDKECSEFLAGLNLATVPADLYRMVHLFRHNNGSFSNIENLAKAYRAAYNVALTTKERNRVLGAPETCRIAKDSFKKCAVPDIFIVKEKVAGYTISLAPELNSRFSNGGFSTDQKEQNGNATTSSSKTASTSGAVTNNSPTNNDQMALESTSPVSSNGEHNTPQQAQETSPPVSPLPSTNGAIKLEQQPYDGPPLLEIDTDRFLRWMEAQVGAILRERAQPMAVGEVYNQMMAVRDESVSANERAALFFQSLNFISKASVKFHYNEAGDLYLSTADVPPPGEEQRLHPPAEVQEPATIREEQEQSAPELENSLEQNWLRRKVVLIAQNEEETILQFAEYAKLAQKLAEYTEMVSELEEAPIPSPSVGQLVFYKLDGEMGLCRGKLLRFIVARQAVLKDFDSLAEKRVPLDALFAIPKAFPEELFPPMAFKARVVGPNQIAMFAGQELEVEVADSDQNGYRCVRVLN